MSLPPGTRLGPFEIVSSIGSGGMGEVYRARDRRLARDVAVKILKPQARLDPERLWRFQDEARAMSAVSHPALLAVYDVGETDGAPYLVSELLEGETLRERLAQGALPLRKALEYARQVAHGLAAAHEKGIVHRDLKPENVFLTRDGRVKILDFGLARLVEEDQAAGDDQSLTAGRVMGTAGYMSPEQVRGEPADVRSDIFSFGAMLYEMVTGRKAFRGATAVETMNGILKDDPPQLAETSPGIPAPVARVVWHCLEKNPAERFQSARDLAFDLETVEDYSSGSFVRQPGRRRRVPASAVALLLGLAAGVAAHRLLSREAPPPIPTLSRLTFRRGTIESARFSADGQSVVFGAYWDGAPSELFVARPGSPESRPLGFPGAELLALSRSGEMALCLGRRRVGTFVGSGTLAQAPLAGGAPREVQEDVQLAEWSPNGTLAVVRSVAGRNRLEYPIGTVLFETAGWVSDPRFSPAGDRIAFVDHPVWGDDGGNVAVVDLARNVRRLTRDWNSLQGLAWSPSGELWFTGTRQGAARAVHAVSLDGRERALARMAGTLTLHDLHEGGRALVSHQVLRREVRALAPGATEERDLSWLDYAYPSDFSDDGRTLFFAENGEGGGRGYSVYVRRTDGSPAVRLGAGAAMALSPDRKLVFANQNYTSDEQEWMLIPTGAGRPRRLDRGSVRASSACFFPDGTRLAVAGSEPGRPARVFEVDVAAGGPPKPLTPEGATFPLSARPLSPDGRWIALRNADGSHAAYPLDGGAPRPLAGLGPDDQVIRWSGDGASLYVYRPGEIPAVVSRVDASTGNRETVRKIQPLDGAGVVAVTPVLLTPDAASYVYGFRRVLSDLYVVEGLR